MVSVGTIVWLSSELMFFAGLFAMYFTARSQAGDAWPPPPTELNLVQAVPVTLVLIASSFTCQMGVFAAERGDVFGLRRWYFVTFLMGLFFVLGQGNGRSKKQAETAAALEAMKLKRWEKKAEPGA